MNLVRLVRACGSKQPETPEDILASMVRLVRACGSKPEYNPYKKLNFEVRLVRACGSKPHTFRERVHNSGSGS